jgi:hypothetical protein
MRFIYALFLIIFATLAFAHPGGLNSEGCHNNRKTGEYHCHRYLSLWIMVVIVAGLLAAHVSRFHPVQRL